jgi:peptide deformylase
MAERTIIRLGNPLLWTASPRIADPAHERVQQAIRDLDDTLARFRADTGWGRGISAVQIGELQRLSFVRLPRGETFVFINPEIVQRSSETFELWDDCFSFPSLLVRVARNYRIAVRYQDQEGIRRELDAEGDLSELLQHEFDHLDGILAIDRRIDDRSFKMASAGAQSS